MKFSPIFERRGTLIAWLVNDKTVLSTAQEHVALVKSDGAVVLPGHADKTGELVQDIFLDLKMLPVAFVDRSLEQQSAPQSAVMFSPIIASAFDQWSPTEWYDYFLGAADSGR